MVPSLDEFRAFDPKDVRKWLESYTDLKKYGTTIESQGVTGCLLLAASVDGMMEVLKMNRMEADLLKSEVSKVIGGKSSTHVIMHETTRLEMHTHCLGAAWFCAADAVMMRSALEYCFPDCQP